MELSKTPKAVIKAIEIGAKLLMYFAGAAFALLAIVFFFGSIIEADWFGMIGAIPATLLAYLMFYAVKELL